MPSLRVLIVDDEPPARAGVRELLAGCPGFTIAGECRDGREAIDAIRLGDSDVVLLDVQMPEVDGFEVVRRIGPEKMPAVVFFTAFDHFAVTAFEVNAVDYLLKPCSEERFQAAMARVRQRLRDAEVAALGGKLAALLGHVAEAVPPGEPLPARIPVRLGTRVVLVEVSEILWISAEGYCSTLHVGKETHLVRQSLRELEEKLDPRRFVRIHRSAIVNAAQVREVHGPAGGDMTLVLSSGERLAVSRRRRAQLEELLGRPR